MVITFTDIGARVAKQSKAKQIIGPCTFACAGASCCSCTLVTCSSLENSFVSVFDMYVCGRISYPYVRLLGCAAVYMTIVKYCCGAFACFEIEPGLVVSPVPSAHLLAPLRRCARCRDYPCARDLLASAHNVHGTGSTRAIVCRALCHCAAPRAALRRHPTMAVWVWRPIATYSRALHRCQQSALHCGSPSDACAENVLQR
jgi:hypothetical protein